MDALEALQHRVSVPRLTGRVPSDEILENIFRAALRAPDHARLKPWRFLKISGDARVNLGELFVKAQLESDPDLNDMKIDKIRSKPLRAPLIVVLIACIQEHPKVPEIEQLLSAGAAAQNMLIAAFAMGVGAMWRTGSMAYHQTVLDGLGLENNEKVIGYLYLGDVDGKKHEVPELNTAEYFQTWPKMN